MDTVTLKLTKEQAGSIDLLEQIPARLSNVSEHNYTNGLVIAGELGNMRVTVNENGIKIKNSLTKYFIDSNIHNLNRKHIEEAIQYLSDELCLPVQKATVTGLDYAKNIFLKNDVTHYLPYLGDISRYNRYQSKRGINYKIANRELAIYDKIAEMKSHREHVPPIFEGRNVMRIEKRYRNKLASYFNMPVVTAANLYEEGFYMQVLKDWLNDYNRIGKLNNTLIDMSGITTKKELYSMGVLALVQLQGGEVAAIKQVAERQSKGELTKKQALDLRTAIKSSSRGSILSKDNELIKELDEKVREAVCYFR